MFAIDRAPRYRLTPGPCGRGREEGIRYLLMPPADRELLDLPVPRVDLAELLREAAAGRFPRIDGGFSRARPWRDGVEAAVAFTGHAVMVVAEEVSDRSLRELGIHGYGAAHDPQVTLALAGDGPVGVLDVLLVGHGTGTPSRDLPPAAPAPVSAPAPEPAPRALVERPDLASTERARHAALWRDDVQVFGWADPTTRSLATLSRGIGGLPEVGIQAEADDAQRLLAAARSLVPAGEVLLASVTPGNARSLRFFLSQGFVPIGSEQLWQPQRR